MLDWLIRFLWENLTNMWVLFGFLAQFIFFLRFVVQWVSSEKKKKSVIPVSFWYLSITGTLMILVYAVYRQDLVFIVASILNCFIYIRNLILIRTNEKEI